jgi:hypothetical protein
MRALLHYVIFVHFFWCICFPLKLDSYIINVKMTVALQSGEHLVDEKYLTA